MKRVQFSLNYSPEELVSQGTLTLARAAGCAPTGLADDTALTGDSTPPSREAGNVARGETPPRAGDMVLVTVAFESSRRTTAVTGRIERDSSNALSDGLRVRFEPRDRERLLTFLDSGPSPSSTRPIPIVAPLSVREVALPSAFPPAVTTGPFLLARVLLCGRGSLVAELEASLSAAGLLTAHDDTLPHLDVHARAIESRGPLDAILLVFENDGAATHDGPTLMRAVTFAKRYAQLVISVGCTPFGISLVPLFQAGLDDHVACDARTITSASHETKAPERSASASELSAQIIGILGRKLRSGARAAS